MAKVAASVFRSFLSDEEAYGPGAAAASLRAALKETELSDSLAMLMERVTLDAEQRQRILSRPAVTERERASGSVYQHADSFELFIRSGGNVGLYAAMGDALCAAWPCQSEWSLLDIGTGTGLGLAPALSLRRQVTPATPAVHVGNAPHVCELGNTDAL